MKRLHVLVLAASLLPLVTAARSNCGKLACDQVKEDIRTIEAKMRSGYTRAQGEKYEARLRRLKSKRSKICR